MIPKIIHYCWFGGGSPPKNHLSYIKRWKETMPTFEFRIWNESNTPQSAYIRSALANKNWANASNWTRLYALKVYGGIYLDTDIEVIRPLDVFLNCKAFLGFEVPYIDWDGCVNNAVLGAIKGHWLVEESLQYIEREYDGTESAHLSSPNMTTSLLREKGLMEYREQVIRDVSIYPIEYFYPYGWNEDFNSSCIKGNTHTIHWYGKSWAPDNTKIPLKRRVKKELKLLYWNIIMRNKVLRQARDEY